MELLLLSYNNVRSGFKCFPLSVFPARTLLRDLLQEWKTSRLSLYRQDVLLWQILVWFKTESQLCRESVPFTLVTSRITIFFYHNLNSGLKVLFCTALGLTNTSIAPAHSMLTTQNCADILGRLGYLAFWHNGSRP